MGTKMFAKPSFSIIVPTRGRPDQLRRFLDSLKKTTYNSKAVEVILVVDRDDVETNNFRYAGFPVKTVVVPPGLTMGALNMEGYGASTGEYIMLLNDDVVSRTKGWDRRVLKILRSFPDKIVLVHTTDWLFNQTLCTFPLVSRTFCELVGGICPREYIRYRIDDHITDIFNLLGVLEERRIVYVKDVVFEHLNFAEKPGGQRWYLVDQAILARDAPRFDRLFLERKELALRLKAYIAGPRQQTMVEGWRRKLAIIDSPWAIGGPDRLCPGTAMRDAGFMDRLEEQGRRIRTCFDTKGFFGLLQAAYRQLSFFSPRFYNGKKERV